MLEAISYPAPNLKRDKTFPLLDKFKNAKNKKIIVYHFDERLGIPVAKLFFDKGYDNVFLVSGGIEEFSQ
jgi:centrosomal protein CEP41